MLSYNVKCLMYYFNIFTSTLMFPKHQSNKKCWKLIHKKTLNLLRIFRNVHKLSQNQQYSKKLRISQLWTEYRGKISFFIYIKPFITYLYKCFFFQICLSTCADIGISSKRHFAYSLSKSNKKWKTLIIIPWNLFGALLEIS